MDINNIQALIAQGLITDVASVDPNKAYVAVGIFQPGNRPAGSSNANTYPSYAIPVSEFLSGAGVLTGVQNGLSLVGTVAELGGSLIHTTDININGQSLLFKNGVYPILFLDPGKQQVAIGGNNPSGMLDITAVGSGTVGLQLNTASTQDAKLHFRTNNAATARAQVYVEDATQTFNVYTVNSDTIFWNGNGLAQTKTLTLFTDTTASFTNNLGIGNIPNSTSRLYVQGTDSTSSYYALKVDNSASSPLLYVRNDGNVGIGTILPTAKLDVRGQIIAGPTGNITSNDSPFYAVRTNLGSPNYYTGMQFAFEVGGGYWGIGFNYPNDQYQFLAGSTAKFIFGYGNPTTPTGKFIMDSNGGYFGANTTSPTATIHAKGLDSTASNYALKVDNSASSPLLYVRNDGNVGIDTSTPTSKLQVVGLSSYIDNTAALGAGLTAGAMYIRTGHGLDIVV